MARIAKKIAMLTCVMGLPSAILLGVAVPSAHATVFACQDYLRGHGYTVGRQATNACETGAKGGIGRTVCAVDLRLIGVTDANAYNACLLAEEGEKR
jgi:hypothetical protein